MTPTPETGAPCSVQYFSLVDIPKEVHAAALALQIYFEQQGQREWRFCAVADRRLVEKLERERDEMRNALENIEDRFVDGENTYDDWLFMGTTARTTLYKLRNHLR
jgi:hypothetical protein